MYPLVLQKLYIIYQGPLVAEFISDKKDARQNNVERQG